MSKNEFIEYLRKTYRSKRFQYSGNDRILYVWNFAYSMALELYVRSLVDFQVKFMN